MRLNDKQKSTKAAYCTTWVKFCLYLHEFVANSDDDELRYIFAGFMKLIIGLSR